jgi:hypothetical protein
MSANLLNAHVVQAGAVENVARRIEAAHPRRNLSPPRVRRLHHRLGDERQDQGRSGEEQQLEVILEHGNWRSFVAAASQIGRCGATSDILTQTGSQWRPARDEEAAPGRKPGVTKQLRN